MMKRSEIKSQRSVGCVLFVFFVFFVPSLFAQNVVPVQANTNGVLLSPSPFLRANITGAGNIAILQSLSGNGIIISNTSGDVTLGQLSSVSNILRTNFVFFDSISSNYLYTLIVGGGAGEVNVNANAGATNSLVFGWINQKSGVTNFIKTVQPGYGMSATNQTTNLVLAVDGEVIASQPQLNTASNALRTFVLSRPTNTFPASQFTVVGGTQVFFKTAATVTNLNSLGTLSAVDLITSGGVEVGDLLTLSVTPLSLLYVDGGGIVTPVTIAPHIQFTGGTLSTTGIQPASINLTNWALYPTNIWNSRQGGSLILSNFIAMGITNIIAGTNTIITTNAGVLVISAVPGVGGGSGVIATNPNQFGASAILTIKDEPWFTNLVSFGSMNGFHALFDGMLTVVQETYLEGGVYIYGARTTANTILGLDADLFVQSIVISNGLTFTGTNLSADVTTPLLNTASNVLRSFMISSATTTSNSLLATLIASDVTTSNGVISVLIANDITTSNGVVSLVNTKQHGTQILTNFQAMGITNVIAGTNVIIRTNGGVLVINGVPDGVGAGLTNITSANETFTSLLSASNQPIVKTISAGANITLTNNVTNVVIAASGGFGSPITTTNFTNNASSWSPPAGTTRIRVRAWGAGGDGGARDGANPGTGGGAGGYGESVFAATGASSFDLFVGAPTGNARDTYIRAAGSGVDLMRLAGGTNGASGAEPTFSGGDGGNAVLANWGLAGEKGWYRDDGVFGGHGGNTFGSSGGQGGNDWTPGVAVGYGDGRNGRNPGGGGGGGRGNVASTGGIGGLGMLVIESFGSP